MFTPISASGKSVGELIFLIEASAKNLKNYAELTEFILNLKKSQTGREKVSIMMNCCGTRKSHPRT